MINFMLGSLGGGKSYEAVVFHVLPALKAGRKIITNLPLKVDYIYSVLPEAIGLIQIVEPTADNPIPFSTLKDYGDTWRREDDDPDKRIGPLYIIDECHKALPRGSTRRDVNEWFAESRHELCDVLLLTQSYGKISRDIVDLVQLVYRVRKNVALGSNTTYVRKVQDGVRGQVVNTTIRSYDPAYFKFYRSHTKSNAAAVEAYANDVKPFWQHWSVIGCGLCLLLFITLASTGKLNLFGSLNQKDRLPAKPAAAAIPTAITAPAGLPRPQGKDSHRGKDSEPTLPTHPFYRVELHIAGFITSGEKWLYNISASQNGQPQFQMTSEDLLAAGYQLEVVAPCAMKIRYQEFTDYLTCDAPRVSLAIADGSGSHVRPAVAQQEPETPKTLVVGNTTEAPRSTEYKSIYSNR